MQWGPEVVKGMEGAEEMVAAAPCTSLSDDFPCTLAKGLGPSHCPMLALSFLEHFCRFYNSHLSTHLLSRMPSIWKSVTLAQHAALETSHFLGYLLV